MNKTLYIISVLFVIFILTITYTDHEASNNNVSSHGSLPSQINVSQSQVHQSEEHYLMENQCKNDVSTIPRLNSFGSIVISERLPNNSAVRFNENIIIIPKTDLNKSITTGKMYLQNWTHEIGITVPCYIQGGEATLDNNSTSKGFHDLGLCISTSSQIDLTNERCIFLKTVNYESELPPGRVHMATYAIPLANTSWDKWDHVYCSKVIDYLSVCGHPELWVKNFTSPCYCNSHTIIKKVLDEIDEAGFSTMISSEKSTSNEIFSQIEIYIYRKGDEYLYVEFAKVKGMDLVRVLMIMGDEEIVKAYAEAFSARTPTSQN
ncbi:hypothetical protein GQS_05330 [Thermococcus sp. 4557]|uniref:hypothetical protein n=1 Tax=Thermococcus sp. (strain CGMCC 1.5172 / 4557) TaxID=1042877 RepID=UPI000219ED70|nr:hypothetical protein [Thermococcus sp. 4557]AEK72967.1 hypothetical protein GQS_05330 [Thermococcus sp. 4557]